MIALTAADALRDATVVRGEALLLLAHASGRSREALLASPEAPFTTEAAATYAGLRDRREAGEPIAYLLGRREFYGRPFVVDPHVLIPRPETELLVDLAIDRCRAASRVVDLGTGSGVVAITIALERPRARVVGTDASTAALDVARRNAVRLDASVAWSAGSWFDALEGVPPFDLIVSNPPYIAVDDRHLREGDLRFEPAIALTDGSDGLSAIRAIVAGARRHLVAGGELMIEHGHDQAAVVHALFDAAGFVDIDAVRDLAGIARVTRGRAPDAAV